MSTPVILVVEDDAATRNSLTELLEREHYEVRLARGSAEALADTNDRIDAVLLGYRLPDAHRSGANGFALLRALRARHNDCPILMMTEHASIDHAVEAMRSGSTHYLPKPLEDDAVTHWLRDVLRPPDRRVAEQACPVPSSLEGLVGRSEAMRTVRAMLGRIARSPATTVLLTGESGTGKSVAARALHAASDRAAAPFMNITCTALTPTLLESELFGHERGAFTDAKTRKMGLFELAHGGTVFLDEVGDMAPELQAKLLRVLEERSFRRVGGTVDLHTDVRVTAATNVDLHRAIGERRFREDLYYRLAVFVVHIPTLRQRPEDIPELVHTFVEEFSQRQHVPCPRVHPNAMNLLRTYPWPGNVRELRNVVERAMVLADGGSIDPDVVQLCLAGERPAIVTSPSSLRLPPEGLKLSDLERQMIEQALHRTRGNITRAAGLLGISRDQMRYRVEKLGLSRKGLEGSEPQ